MRTWMPMANLSYLRQSSVANHWSFWLPNYSTRPPGGDHLLFCSEILWPLNEGAFFYLLEQIEIIEQDQSDPITGRAGRVTEGRTLRGKSDNKNSLSLSRLTQTIWVGIGISITWSTTGGFQYLFHWRGDRIPGSTAIFLRICGTSWKRPLGPMLKPSVGQPITWNFIKILIQV